MPKLVIFNVWCMSNSFMTINVTAWRLRPSKNWIIKTNERNDGVLLLQENILSAIQSVIFIKVKVVRKIRNTDETISIYPLVSVNKYCIKISVSKYVRNCNSMQRMIYDKTNCCLKNAQLFCPKGKTEFLWGILMWSHHQ